MAAAGPGDGIEINGVAHVILRVNRIAEGAEFRPAPELPLSGRARPEDRAG